MCLTHFFINCQIILHTLTPYKSTTIKQGGKMKPRLETYEHRHYAICPICNKKFYIASKKDYINQLWIKNKKQFFALSNVKVFMTKGFYKKTLQAISLQPN